MDLEIRYLNKTYSLINKKTFTNISNKESISTNSTRILNDLILFFSLDRNDSKIILTNWLKSKYELNAEEINLLIPSKELIINDEISFFISSITVEELFGGLGHDFKISIPRATRVEISFNSNDIPLDLLHNIENKIGNKLFNSKFIDNILNFEYLLFGCTLSHIEYGDSDYDDETNMIFRMKLVCNNYVKNE